MRVIAGSARGQRLYAPPGPKTRPTSDLVRGAVFDLLEGVAEDWERVLDLFAGSGALGIEALSRGAGWVDFVEVGRRACEAIKSNLARIGFADRGRVYCMSARRALDVMRGPYSVAFLDPPYAYADTSALVEKLAESALMGDGSVVVVEYSRRRPAKISHSALEQVKSRGHGDTCIDIFKVRKPR